MRSQLYYVGKEIRKVGILSSDVPIEVDGRQYVGYRPQTESRVLTKLQHYDSILLEVQRE